MLTSSDNVQDAGGAIEARPASGPRVDASWTTLTRTASASSARSTSRCASHKHHASVVYFRWNPSEELPLQSPEFAATMWQTHQQRVPPRCRPQLRGPETEETESLRAGDVLTRGVSQVEIFEVCAHRNCQSGLERPGAGHAMQAGRPNPFWQNAFTRMARGQSSRLRPQRHFWHVGQACACKCRWNPPSSRGGSRQLTDRTSADNGKGAPCAAMAVHCGSKAARQALPLLVTAGRGDRCHGLEELSGGAKRAEDRGASVPTPLAHRGSVLADFETKGSTNGFA